MRRLLSDGVKAVSGSQSDSHRLLDKDLEELELARRKTRARHDEWTDSGTGVILSTKSTNWSIDAHQRHLEHETPCRLDGYGLAHEFSSGQREQNPTVAPTQREIIHKRGAEVADADRFALAKRLICGMGSKSSASAASPRCTWSSHAHPLHPRHTCST